MTAFLTSLFFITLAEMGDKTQLLSIALATRFHWQTVLWGISAAILLNQLLAVLVGHYLTQLIPMNYLQIAAAASFILFGLWTLRGEEEEGVDNPRGYSPFWTVAISFFAAEMGDKTQLTTVALAAQFNSIIPVWLGTTGGMLIANGLGIIAGMVLGKRISADTMKWAAVVTYIAFGLYGLYDNLPPHLLTPVYSVPFLALLVLSIYLLVRTGQSGAKARR
ncbi:MAG: TMEM165/GDT1 family protein [Negativicutes bacterium]|nr:TMEM165/GDT1 family protein [Negativicutes bacterium]